MLNKKIILLIITAITAVIIIIIGIGVYKLNFVGVETPFACTQEAKICPDGSAVGRVGPKCEFSPCTVIEKPQAQYGDLIKVDTPQASQVVNSPIVIKGQARGNWYFEASFPASLLDSNGNILTQTPITAQGEWMTADFVPFAGQISYQVTTTTKVTLVLHNDNPSGLPENDKKIEIPLVLMPVATQEEMMDVKVYFLNNNLDKEITCNKVFPVIRRIPKTQAVASATMAELLKGPLDLEKQAGYSTVINPGVKFNKLTIVNGVAKIDFNSSIEGSVAGSCRVTAIRAEITQTLKQFSAVKEVVISVDGRIEDILQP